MMHGLETKYGTNRGDQYGGATGIPGSPGAPRPGGEHVPCAGHSRRAAVEDLGRRPADQPTRSMAFPSSPARCSAGFSGRVTLNIEFTNATWEKACGKSPTNRPG